MKTIPEINEALCRALGFDPTRVKNPTLRLEVDKPPICTVETYVLDESTATEIVVLDIVAREPVGVADVTGLGQKTTLWARTPPRPPRSVIEVSVDTAGPQHREVG